MNKYFFGILAGLFIFCRCPVANAHFFQTDGPITTILHIDPNDDPIVGQPAFVSVSVTDADNKFKAADCDCEIIISRNGQQLLSEPLAPIGSAPSIFEFKVPFTFSQKAIYHFVITGSPKTPEAFKNFTTSYDIRVDKEPPAEPTSKASSFNLKDYWGVILILLLDVVIIIVAVKQNSQKETKDNN